MGEGRELNDAGFLAVMGQTGWASIRLANAAGLTVEQTRRVLRRLKRQGHVDTSGQLWRRATRPTPSKDKADG